MESCPKPSNVDEINVERGSAPPASSDMHTSAFKGLGWLDKLLALWILLAMIIGILLGNFVPSVGPALQRGTFVGVSIPIGARRCRPPCSDGYLTGVPAIGLLIMMYPILCKVKFESLHLAFRHRDLWIQIGFSIVMNWLIAPFVMVSSLGHVVNDTSSKADPVVPVGSVLGLSPRQVGTSRWPDIGRSGALHCHGECNPRYATTAVAHSSPRF